MTQLEVIVCDGGSGAAVLAMLELEYAGVRVSSKPDDGIYDAMNRGLKLSSGMYVWFLNGGDECVFDDWRELLHVMSRVPGGMTMFAYELDFGRVRVYKSARDQKYIWHGLPTSHQAIIYPGHIARRNPYDLSYRVSGDYAFTAALLNGGTIVTRSSITLSRFHSGGVSSSSSKLIAIEAWRVQREVLGMRLPRRLASFVRHTASRAAQSIARRL